MTVDYVIECIEDYHCDECGGEVKYRMSLTGTGMAIPRCDKHWGVRLENHQAHMRVYPDSPMPPSWFDPMDAGEVWDDD